MGGASCSELQNQSTNQLPLFSLFGVCYTHVINQSAAQHGL